MDNYSIRTDIAIEDNITQNRSIKEYNILEIKLSETIINSNSDIKKPGKYYMLDLDNKDINDSDDIECIIRVLSGVIRKLLIEEDVYNNHKRGMIVGLGNSNITPDALGPMVVDDIIVTRHMFIMDKDNVSEGINNICAISPNVMGNTGIETSDIVTSIIKNIDLDYIIVIDALATMNVNRLNNSIQVTNGGITPGSGVGNNRKELSKSNLHIPVIAIGVPTVIDAMTITINVINEVLNHLMSQSKDEVELKKEYLGSFALLEENEQRALINSVLKEKKNELILTAKEVDITIKNLSEIIASSIDRAVHPIIMEEVANI